ncbi:uncharacterized protein LOC127867997 isoform X2 [Dreissena polymorpha]|uniref:uncharacterized protein LOC127867997 isoform X2 n=1 Tax=Dreissena polymorpha TaxID=45954 RepID=UPI002264AE6D|nr:uncharacterized protein LOC127867997 isoform X2 [Dreissena polymorpha]
MYRLPPEIDGPYRSAIEENHPASGPNQEVESTTQLTGNISHNGIQSDADPARESAGNQRDQGSQGQHFLFTVPTIPAPQDVDCHIELQTIQIQGGKCTQLGGDRRRPYICQSGPHIVFEPRCRQIVENRRQRSRQQLPVEGAD